MEKIQIKITIDSEVINYLYSEDYSYILDNAKWIPLALNDTVIGLIENLSIDKESDGLTIDALLFNTNIEYTQGDFVNGSFTFANNRISGIEFNNCKE